MIIRFKIFEQKENIDNIDIYMNGDTNREMFVYLVNNGDSIGGLYCALSPSTNEKQFCVMKVAVSDKYKGKGYGNLLYLSAMAILDDKGLSPHRRKGHSSSDAQIVWKKLSEKDYIQRIDLDKKIYKNEPLLDSKYILTNDDMKNKLLSKIKKISDDAFDTSNNLSEQAWNIVNTKMNAI